METPHNKMILEPAALTIENGPTNQRMTEVWKGPWSEIRKLTDLRSQQVFDQKLYPGLERPNLSGTYWEVQFAAPKVSVPLEDKKWIIVDVQGQQLGAGDYGTLQIQYETRGASTGTGGGDGVPDNAEKRRPTTWTMSFEQHTRSPLAYAESSAVNQIYQCYSNQHPPTWGDVSAQGITSADFKYCYYTGEMMSDGKTPKAAKLEGEKNRRIYDYMMAGITPQFHLPVVSREAYFALSAGDAMSCHIDDLDKVVELPQGCPYYWTGVEWIKTADDFTVTQSNNHVVDYTRKTTWTAAPHWDRNFYGASAWTPTKYDGT